VRGYREAARLGRYAWAASGEYRFPLALVHRGLGAWPVYLGRLSGALFADAGDAWDPGADEGAVDPGRRILASVGGELAAEIILLYDFGMLFRTGVAFPLVDGRGTQVYVGLGLPF